MKAGRECREGEPVVSKQDNHRASKQNISVPAFTFRQWQDSAASLCQQPGGHFLGRGSWAVFGPDVKDLFI